MAVGAGIVGVLALMATGLIVAGDMVGSRVLVQMGWPYWPTNFCGYFLSSIAVLIYILIKRLAWPMRRHAKWLVFRGLFGAGYWGLGILAVQVGASPGDAGALMSVNVVVAALLGRLCLGERLRVAHLAAVSFSVGGAMLISRPPFLFGGAGVGSSSWVGHLLAIFAGVCQSCAFICSRHLADLNVNFCTLVAMLGCAFLCTLMPATGAVSDAPIQVLLNAAFAPTTAWIAGAFAIAMGGVSFACLGAVLCPAAVSATVYTACTMLFGYLAEVVIFGTNPQLVTLGGSGLMLLAVACMACARPPPDKSPDRVQWGSEDSPPSAPSRESTITSASLTSFIFSEVCDFKPASERGSLRMSSRISSRRDSAMSLGSAFRRESNVSSGRRGTVDDQSGTDSFESGSSSGGLGKIRGHHRSGVRGGTPRSHTSMGSIDSLPDERKDGGGAAGLADATGAADAGRASSGDDGGCGVKRGSARGDGGGMANLSSIPEGGIAADPESGVYPVDLDDDFCI